MAPRPARRRPRASTRAWTAGWQATRADVPAHLLRRRGPARRRAAAAARRRARATATRTSPTRRRRSPPRCSRRRRRVDEVPADWRAATHGGVVIGPVGDPLAVRSAASDGEIDVVVERRGSAFGSRLAPDDADVRRADAPARAGRRRSPTSAAASGRSRSSRRSWAGGRSSGVDRVPVAIEVAPRTRSATACRRTFAVADLAVDPVPLAPLLLVNAPPPVHERVAASLDASVQHVIVSGIVSARGRGGRRRATRLRGRRTRWARRTSGSRCG